MSEPPPDYENSPKSPEHSHAQEYGQAAPGLSFGHDRVAPFPQYGHPQGMLPPQQSNTTVIINQPTAYQNERMIGTRDGHRDWSSGLFACCEDVGNCLMTMFCPNCVLADISARLGECICVTCCIPGGIATIRTRVRTLGGIRGSMCKDYLATGCCQPCVICQIHRELQFMGL